jgi:hypothetical protein
MNPDSVSRFAGLGAPRSVATTLPGWKLPEFDLESLRETPGLLGEFERLVARWSASPLVEAPFLWPKAVEAPPELKAFYAIAHHWPAARLYGSQDFLRPLNKLARDGGRLTFITENQGNFRIALESRQDVWTLWACTLGNDWPWVPMDGTRLTDLLVTYGLQELVFGARYLTAHTREAIDNCKVGGGFVPLWRGTYVDDAEWTFLWHPSGAIAGKLDRESWYWCGQTKQGPLWKYLGEPEPNETAAPMPQRRQQHRD